MKPALTPEEWAQKYVSRRDDDTDPDGYYSDGSRSERGWTVMQAGGQIFVSAGEDGPPCIIGLNVGTGHALAALCLHGQPFGFTWEDVEALLVLVKHEDVWRHERSYRPELVGAFRDLAGRIAALLPPK